MIIDQRIPDSVQPIIEDYVLSTNKHVPHLINAFYLVGSIALGEFNERFSDIDFVTVLNRSATATEIEQLREIHQTIEINHLGWKMSGSYIQVDELGKLDDQIGPHPQFHDGVLRSNAQNGLNTVTWWELKHHGIAVLGTEPQNLSFKVDWNVLITKMKENMNSYWMSWTKNPRRVIIMYTDWGIQWAVLGVLRQFYTFGENSITTKLKAAEYAIKTLPGCWHQVIQEAINIREGQKKSTYRSKFIRTIEAVNFLKYIIKICNANYTL